MSEDATPRENASEPRASLEGGHQGPSRHSSPAEERNGVMREVSEYSKRIAGVCASLTLKGFKSLAHHLALCNIADVVAILEKSTVTKFKEEVSARVLETVSERNLKFMAKALLYLEANAGENFISGPLVAWAAHLLETAAEVTQKAYPKVLLLLEVYFLEKCRDPSSHKVIFKLVKSTLEGPCGSNLLARLGADYTEITSERSFLRGEGKRKYAELICMHAAENKEVPQQAEQAEWEHTVKQQKRLEKQADAFLRSLQTLPLATKGFKEAHFFDLFLPSKLDASTFRPTERHLLMGFLFLAQTSSVEQEALCRFSASRIRIGPFFRTLKVLQEVFAFASKSKTCGQAPDGTMPYLCRSRAALSSADPRRWLERFLDFPSRYKLFFLAREMVASELFDPIEILNFVADLLADKPELSMNLLGEIAPLFKEDNEVIAKYHELRGHPRIRGDYVLSKRMEALIGASREAGSGPGAGAGSCVKIAQLINLLVTVDLRGLDSKTGRHLRENLGPFLAVCTEHAGDIAMPSLADPMNPPGRAGEKNFLVQNLNFLQITDQVCARLIKDVNKSMESPASSPALATSKVRLYLLLSRDDASKSDLLLSSIARNRKCAPLLINTLEILDNLYMLKDVDRRLLRETWARLEREESVDIEYFPGLAASIEGILGLDEIRRLEQDLCALLNK